MHATTRCPVPNAAEMALASTLDHAGQAAPPVRPASGDSVSKAGMADEDRQREFEERARRWQRSLAA